MALILGCSIAVWFETVAGEPSTSTSVKVVTLILLEAAADVLKGAAFAMYKINLGHVSYNLIGSTRPSSATAQQRAYRRDRYTKSDSFDCLVERQRDRPLS